MMVARPKAWLLAASAVTLLACEGRRRMPSADAVPSEEPRTGPAVALLDLSDGIPEEAPRGLLGIPSSGASMSGLVREVELLTRDKDLRGVLVELGAAPVGLARAGEAGAMLASLGERIPVFCHADQYGNGTLYLAGLGCKRSWVSPGASVDAIGIAAQTVYFHELLSDKLGIAVDFLQVGKFKGAEEPFTRNGPSPEARQSLETTLSDMRAVWLDGIRRGRSSAAEQSPEDGPYSATAARERGLVDEVGYLDDAKTALEESTGAVRARVVLGPQSSRPEGVADLVRTLAGDSLGAAPVALVRATGAISMDGGGLLGEGGGIVERRLSRTLTRLQGDDEVRAVVLRIDSPGGSALASDLLWQKLMRLRKRKVLVVSVGAMAASGGYYLASTGQVLFADDTSIIGSIGVVGGKLAADSALERIGVHGETFPAKRGDTHAAARAAYESLLVPWDEATRQRVLETMTGVYDLFLRRVAEGRGIPLERVAASAEGRLFSGRSAVPLGLVDEVGGLREAIARAKALAQLPPDARVTVAGPGGGFLLRALGEDDQDDERADDAPARVTGWVRGLAPDLVPFVGSLAPLVGNPSPEHILCALPFALTVR